MRFGPPSLPLLLWLLASYAGAFAKIAAFAQDPTGLSESVRGLSIHATSTNTLLDWPSTPRESFLVMVRSNPAPDNQWTILANPLHASPLTNRTLYVDAGGATRPHPGHTNRNLNDLYCVLLIPDFWASPKGVTLDGGAEHCGADFLPIYTGTPEIDPFNRPFGLHVEMVLDSERATEEESFDLRDAVEEGAELVNVGTPAQPRWVHATGFWLQHDHLTNGPHTLQLRTLLKLNLLVGPGEQFLTITNPSVRVLTRNSPAAATHQEPTKGKPDQNWWSQRLGPDFRRKAPEQAQPETAPKLQLIARPLDLATAQR